jgi:hypothetical protein
MGTDHPLRPLVIRCLDLPEDRPEAKELVEFLETFKVPEEDDKSTSLTRQSGNQNSPPRPSSSMCIPTPGYDYTFKVVVLGIPGVGKTSIIQRFLHPDVPMFCTSQTTFHPGDYFERLQIRGKTVHLHIVDTPGEVKSVFHNAASEMPLIYRGVNGIAVVFDVGYRESFTQLSFWIEIVRVSIQWCLYPTRLTIGY